MKYTQVQLHSGDHLDPVLSSFEVLAFPTLAAEITVIIAVTQETIPCFIVHTIEIVLSFSRFVIDLYS